MVAVGIDIGSLYSRIAVLGLDGAPMLCPDQEQSSSLQTLSTVHIGESVMLVGTTAEELLELSPKAPAVRNPAGLVSSPDPALTDAKGRRWHGDALVAVMLKKLCRDVRSLTNENVSAATVVVPAHADRAISLGMKNAILLAGLTNSRVIETPVAAATYHASIDPRQDRLLVVDLGAGGHGCAVVVKGPEGFTVAAHAGSTSDGSGSIDRRIVEIMARQFLEENGVDLLRDPVNEMPLRQLAEQIKIRVLGRDERPSFRETVLVGRKVMQIVLTRRHLAAMALKVLESVEKSVRECLAAAGPVDGMLLTGGARQLFGLRQALSQILPGVPVIERENAAVFGAAMVAAGDGQRGAQGRADLLVGDIGMRVWNAVANAPDIRVLIANGTALPAQQTITLYTRRSNQERLVLDLMRRTGDDPTGESLATFEFGPFVGMPKDHPVEIVVTCDVDGIIKVTARDPQTRRQISQYSSERENAGAERLARQRDLIASLSVNE